MDDAFDPYHKWLGIPPGEQPPDHYRLLGLSVFEDDAAVIESSADRQMTHVRTFQTGPHGTCSQRLLNEIAAARLCLLKPPRKAQYDQALRDRLAGPPAGAVPIAPAALIVAPIAMPLMAPGAPSPAVAIVPPADIAPVAIVTGQSVASATPARSARRRNRIPLAPVAAAVAVLAVVAGLLIAAGQRESVAPQTALARDLPDDADTPAAQPPKRPVVRIGNPSESTASPVESTAPAETPSNRIAVKSTNQKEPVRAAPPGKQLTASAVPRPVTTPAAPPLVSIQPKTIKSTPTPSPASADLSLPKTQAATPRRPSKVHKDAIRFDGNWYLFSEEKAGFVQAFATAKRFRGRMLVISSPEENAFVASHIKGPTWLGMERQGTTWTNAMQRPQSWFNWDRGQPQSNPREVFAAIHQSGRWHDYLPDTLYLCIEWGDE